MLGFFVTLFALLPPPKAQFFPCALEILSLQLLDLILLHKLWRVQSLVMHYAELVWSNHWF